MRTGHCDKCYLVTTKSLFLCVICFALLVFALLLLSIRWLVLPSGHPVCGGWSFENGSSSCYHDRCCHMEYPDALQDHGHMGPMEHHSSLWNLNAQRHGCL